MSRNTISVNGYNVAWGEDHAIGFFIDVFMASRDLSVGQETPVFQIEWDYEYWPDVQGIIRNVKRGYADIYLVELHEPLRNGYMPSSSHIEAYDDEVFYKAHNPIVSRATIWDGLTQSEMIEILKHYTVQATDDAAAGERGE